MNDAFPKNRTTSMLFGITPSKCYSFRSTLKQKMKIVNILEFCGGNQNYNSPSPKLRKTKSKGNERAKASTTDFCLE